MQISNYHPSAINRNNSLGLDISFTDVCYYQDSLYPRATKQGLDSYSTNVTQASSKVNTALNDYSSLKFPL